MAEDVLLPNLGFGMEEGRLLNWLKQPGEPVKKGEPIAEIESDKATVELEALIDGTLEEILVPANSVVPVGSVLARIHTTLVSQQGPSSATPSEDLRVTPLARRVAAEQGVNLAAVEGTGLGRRVTRTDVEQAAKPANGIAKRVLAAPAIRKLAREHNIDLTSVKPTGTHGNVTRADLEAVFVPAIQLTEQVPVAGRREIALSSMRQTIGKRLSQIVQEAPHFYVTAELDLTAALSKLPKQIGINNLLLYLTVQTLVSVPDLNATYENGHLYSYDNVNLSIAVALPNGLISPVLHHADDYSLSGLADHARDLISRARENKLRPDELSGGTFTVSNLGVIQQIERFTAIINPPQVAILAVGAARPRPFVIDGGLHIRTTAHLTISADHRIVDGYIAARFLEKFDQHLQAFAG